MPFSCRWRAFVCLSVCLFFLILKVVVLFPNTFVLYVFYLFFLVLLTNSERI